jgi:hypothetical protein
MDDQIKTFEKTHACPKCANSYFTLDVHWMNSYIKTVYICDLCNWSFTKLSNCTSPASSQDPSLQGQSATSEQKNQTK